MKYTIRKGEDSKLFDSMALLVCGVMIFIDM